MTAPAYAPELAHLRPRALGGLASADLLKLRRRRGLWYTCLLLPAAVVLLVVVLAVTGVADQKGGTKFADDMTSALSVIGTILAVLVGARTGSEEHAAGTLRYQLLTGIPRSRLYTGKAVATMLAVLPIAVIPAAAIVIGALVTPLDGAGSLGAGDVAFTFWNLLVPVEVYGLIAFGVGGLMRSTGPAITIALLLNLLGLQLIAVLTLISDWFRHVVLSVGVDRLTFNDLHGNDKISLGSAIIVTLAWVGVWVGAGYARLRRLEA